MLGWMPGISDPGTELAKLSVDESIPAIPVPGPSAYVAALSASGLLDPRSQLGITVLVKFSSVGGEDHMDREAMKVSGVRAYSEGSNQLFFFFLLVWNLSRHFF
ncbi:hypothetical protein ACFX15_007314 [Malus domestica]